jgi:hypothetical protein
LRGRGGGEHAQNERRYCGDFPKMLALPQKLDGSAFHRFSISL